MALTYEFLLARADQAAQEAEDAVLANVRDRSLRSEAAWRTMALQVQKMEQTRALAREEKRELL